MNEIIPPSKGEVAHGPRTQCAIAYRNRFLDAWHDAVESIIEAGRVLNEAKAEMSHGDWLVFVDDFLPVGRRTAQMLMAIAEDRRLANANPVSLLPPHWSTLYDLHKLDDKTLNLLIEKGAVTPELTRAGLKLALARLGQAALPAVPPMLDPSSGLTRGYRTILADPPWEFETWGEAGKDRSPDAHYPTLSIEEIAALPVAELAAEDCALFLWAQWNTIPECRGVIEAWGFRYVTCAFVWVKDGNFGNGYWTRHDTEPCLLATRGRPARLDKGVRQSIAGPRGRHSAKPEEIYPRIERLVAGPYLELFARGPARPGWDVWGNEAEPAPPAEEGASP